MDAHVWTRVVQCDDAVGRPREVTVYVHEDGAIGCTVPPGESLTFSTPERAQAYIDVLAAAVVIRVDQFGDRR
jgi:hypothetical protein